MASYSKVRKIFRFYLTISSKILPKLTNTETTDQHDHHLLEHFWKQNAASRVEICKLYIEQIFATTAECEMFNWLSGERGTRPMELSLVEGGEVLYLPNCQTNLVIALYTLSLLFCKFVNKHRRTRIDRISDWPNGFRSTFTESIIVLIDLFKHTKRTIFSIKKSFGQSSFFIRSIVIFHSVNTPFGQSGVHRKHNSLPLGQIRTFMPRKLPCSPPDLNI